MTFKQRQATVKRIDVDDGLLHRVESPRSWPPETDWVVSRDRNGNPVSLWRDNSWDFSLWARNKLIFRLDRSGADSKSKIDDDNVEYLRHVLGWKIWGSRPARKIESVNGFFYVIRRIAMLCSERGIKMSRLSRHPRIIAEIPTLIGARFYLAFLADLHRIYEAREQLGFEFIDPTGIRQLADANPGMVLGQTPYIPPRIWTYQVRRLKLFLDEFLENKQGIIECYGECVDRHVAYFGSLRASFPEYRTRSGSPFRTDRRYPAHVGFEGFEDVASRHGILDLMRRWIVGPANGFGLRQLSSYLTMAQFVGRAYIANFTLQRIAETSSLRADCLVWDDDEKLGRIAIIRGETTKTDPDSDAHWPASPTVATAVSVMACVASLRIRCSAELDEHMRPEEVRNPLLTIAPSEPWWSIKVEDLAASPRAPVYGISLRTYSKLFDAEQLRITSEDLTLARMLTPGLKEEDGYRVGEVWPLAFHQLRRTGAVNMFASGLVSDSSMQFLMKHASQLMPLYYGRGYAKLRINEEVGAVVLKSMYETLATKLLSALTDRYVSPLGSARKEAICVNLIGSKDALHLSEAARRRQVVFREIRLGVCMNRGPCEYGGIESISRCAGGDGGGPCADALFDVEKNVQVRRELELIDGAIANAPPQGPRHLALQAERQGMRNYLDVVNGCPIGSPPNCASR